MSGEAPSPGSATSPRQQQRDELEEFVRDIVHKESDVPLESGLEQLRRNGIDVMHDTLLAVLREDRNVDPQPFGYQGHCNLYTVSYRLVHAACQTDNSKALFKLHNQSIRKFLTQELLPQFADMTVDEHQQGGTQEHMDKEIATDVTDTAVEVVRRFAATWRVHQMLCRWMCKLFMHLDRGYLCSDQWPSLTACALILFYHHLFLKVHDTVANALVHCVHLDRLEGNQTERRAERSDIGDAVNAFHVMGIVSTIGMPTVRKIEHDEDDNNDDKDRTDCPNQSPDDDGNDSDDRSTPSMMERFAVFMQKNETNTFRNATSLKTVLALPHDLRVYRRDLEPQFVKHASEHYRRVSTDKIEACTIPEYLTWAEDTIVRELARTRSLLHPSSEPAVEEALLGALVIDQGNRLIEAVTTILDECYSIASLISCGTIGTAGAGTEEITLPAEECDTLRRMFELFGRTRGSSGSSGADTGTTTDTGSGRAPSNPTTRQGSSPSSSPSSSPGGPSSNSTELQLGSLMERMANGFRDYAKMCGKAVVREIHERSEALANEDWPAVPAAAEAAKTKVRAAIAPEIVCGLVGLHQRLSQAIREVFHNSARFRCALNDAFADVVNEHVGDELRSITRLLPVHCDRLLRKGGGARISESEAEAALEHCIKLFTYLSDKDMFAEVYRDLLAARLLNDRSISDALERSFVGKLKAHCGGSFTAKLEGMLNDFLIRADYQQEFKEPFEEWQTGQEDEAVRKIEFVPQLLTVSNWPSQKARRVELPDAMASIVTFFNSWYQEKHDNSRKLQWLHTLGDVTVSAVYGGSPRPKKYDVVLAPIQAAVLLLFHNTVDPMTVEDLIVRSGMQQDEEAAKRILHSLFSQPKARLLLKDPAPMPVRRTDLIRVNTEFKSKVRKFRVGMPVLDAQRNVKRAVDDLRECRIDACIVRTMKARKTLAHTDLVGEVLHQLHTFAAEPKLVKRCIEKLIDREYIERDPASASSPSGPQTYRYVA